MAQEDTPAGFFARWSRQKLKNQAAPEIAPDRPASTTTAATPPVIHDQVQPGESSPATPRTPPTPPTWEELSALTPESDFSRFVSAGVDPHLRNAALKTLFKDPHFNVMDGLDVYIEDFGKPDPLPAGMLEQMTQTRALGLWADPADEATAGAVSPGSAESGCTPATETQLSTAETPTPSPTPPPPATASPPHEDPDLRLQSDDPSRRPGAASGPILDTGHER